MPPVIVHCGRRRSRSGTAGNPRRRAAASGTILFVGAGRHQRRAIERARKLGARAVAIDRDPDAPGFGVADEAEVVDFSDVAAVADVGLRHGVSGVMTVASERAVPTVAAVAEALGLPGIGADTARVMTHKVAMRERLAEYGVPQPIFTAVRSYGEACAAVEVVGYPAVVKPVDSSGQRGVFRLESADDLDAGLNAALAASASNEAIIEAYCEGTEVNTLLVANRGDVRLITVSDRLRPNRSGIGFGVALAHVYPSTVSGDVLAEAERVAVAAVRALGLRDGIAYPQLLVEPDRVRVVEVAARIPGGQMDEVPRIGTGVDLVEIALRQALGLPVPNELVVPRFRQPLAISFLTAEPGVLPAGKVRRVNGAAPAEVLPGVLRVETYIQPGETIRPVQVDGDRRGCVLAVGETNVAALERARAAARLVEVEVEP
jgi:biotin carboxylase